MCSHKENRDCSGSEENFKWNNNRDKVDFVDHRKSIVLEHDFLSVFMDWDGENIVEKLQQWYLTHQ